VNIAILDIGTPQDGKVESLAAQTGVKVKSYVVDVTSREQVNQTVESIEQEFGSVDVK
jgi:NADP-dependent 3-hydroxy acid dehydrogenase YdfG